MLEEPEEEKSSDGHVGTRNCLEIIFERSRKEKGGRRPRFEYFSKYGIFREVKELVWHRLE